jgi:pimeloyl-ACP methyl ester carboxylesterase
MSVLPSPLRLLALALGLTGIVCAVALIMLFLGDPRFTVPYEATPAETAAFAASFEQPYAHGDRTFTMRDGVTLTAQEHPGTVPTTIVLVHGMLSSGFMMNRAAGLLRETTGGNVVAVDLRGHGGSGGAPGDISYIGQYEDDLADVIADIHVRRPGDRVILAGHSMGGGISLRYSERAADGHGLPPVDGYLLFAPLLGPSSPTNRWEATPEDRTFIKVHVPRTLALAFFNRVGVTAFNGLRTMFCNLPVEFPLRSYSYRAMVGNAPADHVRALAALERGRKPLLVLVGSADAAFRADRFEAALRPASSGELVIVDGASHDGVLTDLRALAAVESWLERDAGPREEPGDPTTSAPL